MTCMRTPAHISGVAGTQCLDGLWLTLKTAAANSCCASQAKPNVSKSVVSRGGSPLDWS